MSAKLELSMAISDNERTRPVINGDVKPEGINLYTTVVHPSEMFWRQLKFAEFDVSEMSLASLFIAASRGDRRWVALPVFTMRRFFHTLAFVHEDSGIHSPADLKGRKVGVPEYQQTSAVWSRGIFQHEFGLHPSDVEWYMERTASQSHGTATGFKAPEGVRIHQISPSSSIGAMLKAGELDATVLYLNEPNLIDRSKFGVSQMPIRPLFADNQAEGWRYYRKTGIYPINHTLVVRREVLEKHPWVALNLYSAFLRGKEKIRRDALNVIQPWLEAGEIGTETMQGLEKDPLAYGMKSSRHVLETISTYLLEQGLLQAPVRMEDVFAESTLSL